MMQVLTCLQNKAGQEARYTPALMYTANKLLSGVRLLHDSAGLSLLCINYSVLGTGLGELWGWTPGDWMCDRGMLGHLVNHVYVCTLMPLYSFCLFSLIFLPLLMACYIGHSHNTAKRFPLKIS